MIKLNLYYFISNFNEKEIVNLDKKINIIYRNYKETIREDTIKKIKNLCINLRKKFFISNNVALAIKLRLDGVYIPSFNKTPNLYIKSTNKFEILGSAHNLREIRIKEKQGVNTIFLSPIFKLKKTNKFLGVYKFNLLTKLTKKNVIALGGINEKNINQIKLINCCGYAGITYFKDK
jgi:thiamine-phosphate pyrophosphorylase